MESPNGEVKVSGAEPEAAAACAQMVSRQRRSRMAARIWCSTSGTVRNSSSIFAPGLFDPLRFLSP